jgi:2-dehydropantoate 2-reductase
MKMCILGAGAMGGSVGGLLTEAGEDVWLVDTWEEHVAVMVSKRLRLKEQDQARVIGVRATDDIRKMGSVDLAILLVKS